MVEITCLGGAGGVTGSSYLVETRGGKRVLVDCGLFQGGRRIEERNRGPWGFDPKTLNTLILTHAHIDHSGRIPRLTADGFSGKILCSGPTAQLCEILLLDSANIQEMDAEWQTRKNKRNGRPPVDPLYTVADAEASLKLFSPLERGPVMEIEDGIKVRLRNAGHILGSAILEMWIEEDGESVNVVFSGDLGRKDQLIVKDPEPVISADYFFVESTYGNRLHRSLEESGKELLEAIHFSCSHGEKVLIPAFAVERTQEVIYMLGEFHRRGELPDIPIYLDSPLAIKATEIFRKNWRHYDKAATAVMENGDDPLDLPNLKFTERTSESIAINEKAGPAIVIAGNGMCTAGRIKHHLKHNLWREGASLVIVGFQAHGTTGRKIVDGARQVKVFRENVAVNARVFTIGGFSAHADQSELLDWISHFEGRPEVFVTHGEDTASETLARLIEERFGFKAKVPRWKEKLRLSPGGATAEVPEIEDYPSKAYAGLFEAIGSLEQELEALKKRASAPGSADMIEEEDLERLRSFVEETGSILK
ncbi:MAG TPA: MBL fold metallo-hydrolase [Desulfobacteraceae bacterium]|nr:MBL fold metallo-hydrolase [Desulfobacteraceae bacterium]